LLYAGCDLGIVTAKVAIIEDGRTLAFETLPYKGFPGQAAVQAMENALARADLSGSPIDYCLATGLGGKAVTYADDIIQDVFCLHRAVRQLNPQARTVIDVGGHSFTAFNITEGGDRKESAVIDRCAVGTGMILDVMANVLEAPLDELIKASTGSDHPVYINNQCPIFVESEVISLLNDGHDSLDIFAGVASAVAEKIAGMVRRVDVEPEVVMVGGVARNSLVVRNLENRLGLKLADLGGVDPQVIGAYGAALLAGDMWLRTGKG
jgi:predicted CoA-substrate-specific enzyme activase